MGAVNTQQLSLRSGFAWTAAGNLANAASQWLVLALLARAGSAELLGEWALALAVATPIAMLAHLNLRTLVATDVAAEHPFSDYLRVRSWSNLAALAALSIAAAAVGLPVLFLGSAILVDNTSDVLYGALQRSERLDTVAQSVMLRAAASLLLVAATLSMGAGASGASAAYLAGRIVVIAAIDWPKSRLAVSRDAVREPSRVLRMSLPLGFSLLLISLTTNAPRYAIERFAGTRELGVFAAVWAFVAAGTTVVNAMGQSATTRLASAFQSRDRSRFRALTLRLVGSVIVLGLAGIVLAAFIGKPLLRFVYAPDFAQYAPLLSACLAAGIALWMAQVLGFASSSMRVFGPQLPILASMCGVAALGSFVAVPRFGVAGAALALGVSGLAGALGQLWLLRRAL